MSAYSLDQLKADVAAGKIDTVLVAFPDMQGRLIGKRFQAEFFLEGAIDETHGCNYLLADDIDMEPVPGYEAASWDKGYGDFVMKPDLSTLRLTPARRSEVLEHSGVAQGVRLDERQIQELGDAPVVGRPQLGLRLQRQIQLPDRLEAEGGEERHLERQHEQPVQAQLDRLHDVVEVLPALKPHTAASGSHRPSAGSAGS